VGGSGWNEIREGGRQEGGEKRQGRRARSGAGEIVGMEVGKGEPMVGEEETGRLGQMRGGRERGQGREEAG